MLTSGMVLTGMFNRTWKRKDDMWRRLVYLVAPLPAIAFGATIMGRDAPHLASEHAAESMALYVFLMLWTVVNGCRQLRHFYVTFSAVGILLLLGTFIDPGIGNVHRWMRLGGFRLNVGEAFLPAFVVALTSIRKAQYLFALFVFAILFAQPDAGRVTAFAAASWVVFSFKRPSPIVRKLLIVFLLIACLSWTRFDPLGRVSYVEDIATLAFARSWLFGIGSILSLLLLPLPFVIDYRVNRTVDSLALAAYFMASIIVPFVGNFPVPVLGYGASGLVGYFVGLSVLFCKCDNTGVLYIESDPAAR